MPSFIKSATNKNAWIDDDVPEICLVGRSNVGKSTLINALAKQKISFTSKTPGRTQLINFYDFKKYRLVDLPGYGYAKVSKDKQQGFALMINEYLQFRTNLRGLIVVCDALHQTVADQEMINFIRQKYRYVYCVVNKIDKVAVSKRKAHLIKIAQFFNLSQQQVIGISSKYNEGMNEVNQIISTIIN